jgi:hypothetical protein
MIIFSPVMVQIRYFEKRLLISLTSVMSGEFNSLSKRHNDIITDRIFKVLPDFYSALILHMTTGKPDDEPIVINSIYCISTLFLGIFYLLIFQSDLNYPGLYFKREIINTR